LLNLSEIHPDVRKTLHEIENAMVRDISPNTPQAGVGQKIKGTDKKAYSERCQKFADKYMDGDLKRLTYCMKDVYNWHEWLDINREYQEVDYTNVIEEQNNVNPVQEVACAGGKCDII